MTVDPVDDCTFWYTSEYLKTNGTWNWNTWIASFKFSTCSGGGGGTGTTTLAVNAAADLRRITQRPTLIVDLKNGPGDVALFLGLRPRHSFLNAIDHFAWVDP